MKRILGCAVWILSSTIATACQPISDQSASSQPANSSALTPIVSPQLFSLNAFKVPYLGYDGIFYLNEDDDKSFNDVRNPKRIAMERMEKFTFFNDTAGQNPMARDCRYVYVGVVADPKYYPEYKGAVWDVFELEKDDKQDPACNQFKYLTFVAPHGDPSHMHFRYGNDKADVQALVNMSTAPEDVGKFNPWFATYCGGQTRCGKE